MFSYFNNKLTAISNNYVDWSRTADLFRSGHHHYSTEQILVRSAMIITTGVAGFLGYQYSNNEKNTSCSNLTATIAAGALGLCASHVFVIAPLIYKRYKMNQECNQLITAIKVAAKELEVSSTILDKVLDQIMQLSLANEKRSSASLTWGHRKSLLNNLHDELTNKNNALLSALAKDNIDSIVDKLSNKNFTSSMRLRK